ncbi:PD-(D/E)XK nuclease family protein [Haloferax gibbonsii]|uniref:hypothetical protein n=1 Tax=Haloferax gibbonsii TaxID=35746 RepID=UPI0018CFECB8|nr:hypothetical protein [Haloferax gibbonsii]
MTNHIETIEAARKELQTMAGGAESRTDALSRLGTQLLFPANEDVYDLVSGLRALTHHLETHTDRALSESALVREATRAISDIGASLWSDVFPTIERVHLAGMSMIESSLLDFVATIATTAPVDIHLYLRSGTGPLLARRLESRLGPLDLPVGIEQHGQTAISPPTVPVAELTASTRREEARIAMALVAGLLDEGISPSDIIVAARDADKYEQPLSHAADIYGHELSVWTQLPLTQTLPYKLLISTVRLLDAERVDAQTLCEPLLFGWASPKDADASSISYDAVTAARREFADEPPQSLTAWTETLGDTSLPQLTQLVEWACQCPKSPSANEIRDVLLPLLDSYRETVLTDVSVHDSDSFSEIARTARALTRTETLVGELATKYREWVAREHASASWGSLVELADAIATVRPGRREHANATAIDVLDATDTWLRKAPYVIAMGLVDGEWPQPTDGVFPAALRDAVVAGDTSDARTLGIQESWTSERERDHFDDAVTTATELLVCTRFETDLEGARYERSPYLTTLAPIQIGHEETQNLLSQECLLPPSIRHIVEGSTDV